MRPAERTRSRTPGTRTGGGMLLQSYSREMKRKAYVLKGIRKVSNCMNNLFIYLISKGAGRPLHTPRPPRAARAHAVRAPRPGPRVRRARGSQLRGAHWRVWTFGGTCGPRCTDAHGSKSGCNQGRRYRSIKGELCYPLKASGYLPMYTAGTTWGTARTRAARSASERRGPRSPPRR